MCGVVSWSTLASSEASDRFLSNLLREIRHNGDVDMVFLSVCSLVYAQDLNLCKLGQAGGGHCRASNRPAAGSHLSIRHHQLMSVARTVGSVSRSSKHTQGFTLQQLEDHALSLTPVPYLET